MTLRKTHATRKVAAILINEPDDLHWAGDLCRRTGEGSNVISPLLRRLTRAGYIEDAGWVKSALGGSPRHMYRVVDAERLKTLL